MELLESAAKAEHEAKMIKYYQEAAGMGARFEQCTFDNYNVSDGSRLMFEAAQLLVANFIYGVRPADRGLIFTGSVGNGKTHLTAAIINELVKEKVGCRFQPVPELLRKIRATFNRDSSVDENDIISELVNCSLLVLDDVGSEKWTEWAESILYQIIDERYRELRPMVITTNLNLEGLEAALGMRAFDRLLEVCTPVENTAKSYRREIARRK